MKSLGDKIQGSLLRAALHTLVVASVCHDAVLATAANSALHLIGNLKCLYVHLSIKSATSAGERSR